MRSLDIIIADDESIIRMDLQQMLVEAGHKVVAQAVNGQEAVELARKLYPDLVIMDVKMPKLDGVAAARILGQEHIAPVLLLTAYSQQEVVDSANAAGVIAYLVKPIKEEQLFPAMEIALARFENVQVLEKQIAKLQENLEMRKLVERAKGIIMQMEDISEEIAYKKLQYYAMDKRKSIKDVAKALIRQYEQGKIKE